MSLQVMVPAERTWLGIVRGSSERLEALRADVVETKYQLREMLESLGSRHCRGGNGTAELLTPCLGCGEGCLRPLADAARLTLWCC
jgi:hypothetical protein